MRIANIILKPAAAVGLLLTLCSHSLVTTTHAQTFDTVLNTNLFQPASVTISPENHYIIADTANHRIIDFNADNRKFVVRAGPASAPFEAGAVDGQQIDARFRNPQGVLCLGDRTYVADSGNHVIREIDAAGNVRTIAGDLAAAHEADDFGGLPSNWGYVDGPGAIARFSGPSGLASDGPGRLLIADSGNRAIRLLDLNSGQVSTLVRTGLTSPVAVAAGPNGRIFVSDTGAHSIKQWRPGESKATLVAGGGSALARGFRNSSIASNALFSAPAGIYYRETSDELIVADSGNGALRTIMGISGAAPKVDTFANSTAAGFQTPIAVTRDLYGVFLVCDSTRNTLASVITVRFPRIEKPRVGYIEVVVDDSTGLPVARLVPVTDMVFDNMVRLAVSGDSTAQHHLSYSASSSDLVVPALPGTNDLTVVNFSEPVMPAPPESVLANVSLNATLPPRFNFKLKVFSASKGSDERISSLVTDATFRFKCATPNLDSQSAPGRLQFRCATTNAVIYYTMDGTEPNKGGASVQFAKSGDSVPLVLTTQPFTVKARAYLDDRFLPSDVARAEFSPENFIPNRISLGFAAGEASTQMQGAPGQRFFAPVTLSLMPGAQAYGLQFNVSLEPKRGPASSDYQMDFHSMLVEVFPETNRVIPPSTFVLAGTNFVTNFVSQIATNFQYQVAITNYSTLPATNFLEFASRLPESVPVVTTTIITNLGQAVTIATTNYITNSFQLVSEARTTNVSTQVDTSYLYRYSTPGITNILHVDRLLPDAEPVVVTNFVSNLGQLFPLVSTNFITNAFNFRSSDTITNVSVSVDTDYTYRAVTPAETNLVSLGGFVPDAAQVVTTHFVTNLGQIFPVVTTNIISNAFDLVSVARSTNITQDFQTNFSYRAITPPRTNIFQFSQLLPDAMPLVTTDFVTNLGQLFPVSTTNYVSNAFDLLSVSRETNTTRLFETNYVYEATTPAQSTRLVLNRVLPDATQVITTNLISNLGESFPVLVTNRISNAFDLITAEYLTNRQVQVERAYLYEVGTAPRTNFVVLNQLLPDEAELRTTNLVSNLGQQYPVVTTNIVRNDFNLFSVDYTTNVSRTVSGSYEYRSITPATTELVALDTLLPDSVPFVFTSFITNLGQLFPVNRTNFISNSFDLVSASITTNETSLVSTSFLYRAESIPTTNLIELSQLLPSTAPIVTATIVTNLGLPFVVTSTNFVNNSFDLVSVRLATNVINSISTIYQYQYAATPVTNWLLWPTQLPDGARVVTANSLEGSGMSLPIQVTNTVNNSQDLVGLVLNQGQLAYLYEFHNATPAMAFSSEAQLSLTPSVELHTTGYITNLNQTFAVEIAHTIPNPVSLITTNVTTNLVVQVATNATYRYRSPVVTNYLALSTNLPDIGPVVSSVTITNLGQNFQVTVTNYAQNTFELVSTTFATNRSVTLATNAVYQFRTPAVTNVLVLSEKLPDFAPVITTSFLTNLGQSFPVSRTNFVANTFELIGTTLSTNVNSQVQTSVTYVFIEPGTTNYVTVPDLLPSTAPVVTTNFVSNLGQLFPVAVTNYLSNSFRLVSSSARTNFFDTILTNVVYAFETPGTTNRIVWPSPLPQTVPVVTTNFVSNLGQLFPVAVTNYLTNVFRLVNTVVEAHDATSVNTNVLYSFKIPGVTNYLQLPSRLPDTLAVVTTNFIGNLGQLFPVTVTNVLQNSFEFLSANVRTNSQFSVTTNVLYALRSPSITNLVTWPVKLPDSLVVISTNYITNLTQLFPVTVTNLVFNQFELLSTNRSTNVALSVRTNILYELSTPSVTNFFTLDEKLPSFVQVITTNFVTNIGRLFPVFSTNLLANVFDLIQTNSSTNSEFSVSSSYTYSVVVPGTGPGIPVSISTNLVTLDRLLPGVLPIVNLVGTVTNLTEVFPIYSTNYISNSFRLVSESYVTNQFQVYATNASREFAGLTLTNPNESWLAVGWLERFGRTNLFNTRSQNLLSYSQAHNTLFRSIDGESVIGAVSFIVPPTATTGDQYALRIGRPSATADGQSQDMFIQAPLESDTNSPVKAAKTLVVTNKIAYIAGDVSDFRWFNAGEFGDGNILNNDLSELQQAIVYGFNLPPQDSDFLDAMDTCCYTVDGRDLSSMEFATGSSINLNEIAFGEGSRFAPLGQRPNSKLEINDLFVAFRRSLDPDLVWYQRFWSNGTRQASIVPNTFRAENNPLQRQSVSAFSLPSGPAVASTQSPAITVFAGTVTGLPGAIVAVPIRVRVEGGFPLRTLMFNARVETTDGTLVPASSLQILPTDALGLPTVSLSNEPGRPSAAWLNTSIAGILGEATIGRVLFTIPAGAAPTSTFVVKLDRVSGSPNGISLFPSRSGNGLIAMANRPTPVWNDGIPDAWRIKYFGSTGDLRSASEVDADGDGLSNLEEYKLGTDPMDANDNLRVHAVANGRGVKLRFRSASGKKYRIEGSTNLEPGSWNLVQGDVAGTGTDIELPKPGGAHSFYYRVRLQD